MEVWEDLDGIKIAVLKNFKNNPVTTAQRIALGLELNCDDVSISCYDVNEKKAYWWDGSNWVTFSSGGDIDVNNFVAYTSTSSYKTKASLIADETLSGGMLVYVNNPTRVRKFNQQTLNLYHKAIGFTNTSVLINEYIEVVLSGVCSSFGGLVAGSQYFASTNGLITNTVPTTGIVQPVGVAINSSTLLINIQKPYIKIITI